MISSIVFWLAKKPDLKVAFGFRVDAVIGFRVAAGIACHRQRFLGLMRGLHLQHRLLARQETGPPGGFLFAGLKSCISHLGTGRSGQHSCSLV